MKTPIFTCPACGGTTFGRDTGDGPDQTIIALPTVQCHDQFGQKCKWRGAWPEPDAAGALLEACKAALALIKDDGTQGGREWTIKAIETAIAKAEGTK